MNSQMFNSFLDGTKSAIEMAAVANACALDVPHDGLHLSALRRRRACQRVAAEGAGRRARRRRHGRGGVVAARATASRCARDLRWGVYVVFKAPTDYAAACFKQYGLPTDATGRYAAMYKPFHLIGLELSISVLNVALRGEPTGSCRAWRGDAVAVAKRALKAGETLDGEGGYTVYAKLIPAARSLQARRPADRACASRQAHARCRGRRVLDRRRRRARRQCASRAHPPRDGADARRQAAARSRRNSTTAATEASPPLIAR